jgi:beta-lactamase superfamily II metal-dependent hydrolase
MPVRYVRPFTSKLVDDEGKRVTELLWGDRVEVRRGAPVDGFVRARARGRPRAPADGGPRPWGWVAAADLMPRNPLLELYVIDVGQGDSVLMRTPDDRWHLIDGGVAAERQMTRKGAANFLRWKFLDDLGRDAVELETVVLTHADEDHYGGLANVLAGRVPTRDPFPVRVARFYHSGIANFAGEPGVGAGVAGEVAPFPVAGQRVRRTGTFVTELLDDRASFQAPPRPLAPRFAAFAALVAAVPAQVARLSRDDGHLPGYAPGESEVTIHVLGPVVERLTNGARGLRVLGADGVTKNGHSVVLRVDYGDARVLLTGDLNDASQRLLLSYVPAGEFAADVAKACHHGAEKVELAFVAAMQARATVISSGDNEVHAHPRPLLMGASARYGRESVGDDGERMPPLLYSTELARSVALCYASGARVRGANGVPAQRVAVGELEVRPDVRGQTYRALPALPIASDLVYGLVNVRTDGRHVLCATMEEAGTEFDVKVFRAGV